MQMAGHLRAPVTAYRVERPRLVTRHGLFGVRHADVEELPHGRQLGMAEHEVVSEQ